MASPIYVVLRLEPFYQLFLRSYFNCENIIFEFPKKGNFNNLLAHLVLKPPRENSPAKKPASEYDFKVALPYMEHKDVFCYNYISNYSMHIFQSKVHIFFKLIFHTEMDISVHKLKLSKIQSVRIFVEKYNLNVDNQERLVKGYYRYEKRLLNEYYKWNSNKRVRKHRNKEKKASV